MPSCWSGSACRSALHRTGQAQTTNAAAPPKRRRGGPSWICRSASASLGRRGFARACTRCTPNDALPCDTWQSGCSCSLLLGTDPARMTSAAGLLKRRRGAPSPPACQRPATQVQRQEHCPSRRADAAWAYALPYESYLSRRLAGREGRKSRNTMQVCTPALRHSRLTRQRCRRRSVRRPSARPGRSCRYVACVRARRPAPGVPWATDRVPRACRRGNAVTYQLSVQFSSVTPHRNIPHALRTTIVGHLARAAVVIPRAPDGRRAVKEEARCRLLAGVRRAHRLRERRPPAATNGLLHASRRRACRGQGTHHSE